MPKLLTLLSLFLLLFLTSCFDTEDATTGQENGISLNGVVQISKDSLFTGTNDTVWIDIQLEANTTYRFEIKENDSLYGLDGAVYDQSNKIIGNSWSLFKTDNNTAYKLAVWASDPYSAPKMDFTYRFYKYEMPEISIEGTWILCEETWEMQGNSLTLTYNNDSVEQIISIAGDSTTRYEYISEADTAISRTLSFFSIFRDSYINILSETEFTVKKSFHYGSQLKRFKIYTEDIKDARWDRKDFVIPKEYYGNWYIASNYEVGAESKNNTTTIVDDQDFQKEEDIYHFYSINSTGIIEYSRNGWSYEIDKQPDWFTYRFIKNSTVQNNTILYKYFEGNIGPEDDFGVDYEEENLKKLSGEPPLEKWQEVNIPLYPTKLTAGKEYTSSFNKGDTIWFQFPCKSGMEYDFRIEEDVNFNGYMAKYLFSPSKEQLKMHSFTALYYDTYYVVLIPAYYDDSEDTYDFSITLRER